MVRPIVLGITLVLILACGGGGDGGGKKGGKAGGNKAGGGNKKAESAYTLDSVDGAEMACYFTVTPDQGKQRQIRGVYDVCPEGNPRVTDLVGKKVKLTLGMGSEPAPSCGGDFECPDTVEVAIVEAITAI